MLIGLSLGTYALKAAGPLLIGGRRLPPSFDRVAVLIPAALLASLVVVSTIADGRSLTFDARIVGVIAAGLALWKRLPFALVVVIAVAATAATRALA